jgi:glyoxylase-like metal-dependent hydrolase (beta-lactamase superfamily II)/8-oxo-dGTP pyrophosphatase MutT (NUDIX family)
MPRPELGPYGHVVPRQAATVVLLRPGPGGAEVLLTHRPSTMAFAPGMHVFPGGAVDPEDGDPRLGSRSILGPEEAALRLGRSVAPTEALAAHIAALRELFEEAGILLAEPLVAPSRLSTGRSALLAGEASFAEVCERFDARLRTDALVPLSRWVTPPVFPRRFDARFFAAILPAGTDPSFEGDEVVAHQWLGPGAALDGMARGELPMWLPTSANLQRLEHLADVAAVEALASGASGLPEVEPVAPDIVRIAQSAGAGVDGLAVNAYLIGGRELVAIDPGDPSEEALLAIVETAAAQGATVGAVALTSADPDHAGGAEHLREGLGLLVHGGPGVGRPLPFEVGELSDGTRVPSGDLRVVALAAPGPRPDHVAYWVPASRSAIVGDLVGDEAPRSIPGPRDPDAWRRSLGRLATLEPARLLPAHGPAIEGAAAIAAAFEAAARRLR